MHISNRKSEIVNHKSGAPRPGSIAAQSAARRNHQALLRLDHTIRTEAARLGALNSAFRLPHSEIDALVLEARSVFTIVNAVPVARDAHGEIILGDNGLPLTPEHWLHSRLK